MKATLIYWHKAFIRERYVLEMSLYQVEDRIRYPEGMKYRLALVDRVSGRRVIMDNHFPKGPHIHLDQLELDHVYMSPSLLIDDFQMYVETRMGLKI